MKENRRKADFLSSIPQTSIELSTDTLAKRAKFNFSYFTAQEGVGQDFADLSEQELKELYSKLKHYSTEALDYWEKLPIGRKSGHVLEIYERFPARSKFKEPAHIPFQARWGRFRLDNLTRLVGFVLPREFHGTYHPCGFTFDRNTFYVVFYDRNHEFYLMNK